MNTLSSSSPTTLAWAMAEVTSDAEPVGRQSGWYPLKQPASFSWEIQVDAPGAYHASFVYSSATAATPYELHLDGAPVGTGRMPQTDGYFGAEQPQKNFELLEHPVPLILQAGTHRLTLRIEASGTPAPTNFCELRITPETALEALSEEATRAAAARADTTWFQNCGYGLMVHWTSQSQPRRGPLKPYAQAVAEFAVDAFSDAAAATGAAYVMVTANHADPTFPAPLRGWERTYPGWTTKRDLIAELIEALEARGIKLFLYLNLFVAYRDAGRNADAADFVASSCRLLEEIGQRYGARLPGYWIDSCHQAFNQFGSVAMEPIFRACKAGNPDRLTCFNWGVRPVGTPWQEYWSAEVVTPGTLPAADASGILRSGPGKGLAGHALLIMDDFWVHKAPDTAITPPRLSPEELVPFIHACNQQQAPVTLNVGIYQDGSLAQTTIDVVKQVRSALQ